MARCIPLLAIVLTLAAGACAAEVVEKVDWPLRTAAGRAEGVSGELRIPDSAARPLPAVIILTSSPGFDGRGADYARELNLAGFATLELDMFQGRGLPSSPRENLQHVYFALSQLVKDKRIDPARVGVMGFSWGGTVALLAGLSTLAREHAVAGSAFAAHLPLYPVCWPHEDALQGKPDRWWKDLGPATYSAATGRPIHILVGERDVYDAPDGCSRFIAGLKPDVRRNFDVTVFPGATFAWDSRFSSSAYSRGVARGKGGITPIDADPRIAAESRAFAVRYFTRHLRP
jgi:uncharacterized protein